MRRRRPSRLIALPLSLWFVALATDPGHLDACPMHHAMLSDHVAGGHAHGAMAPMGATSSMATMERLDRPASGTAPADDGRPPQCRCIGTCCGGSMLTLPASLSALLPSLHVARDGPAALRATGRWSPGGSYRQPPAIGPPLLHAA